MLKIALAVLGAAVGLVVGIIVFPWLGGSFLFPAEPGAEGDVNMLWPLEWAGCTAIGATAGYWIARLIGSRRA